ncbi:hypothetical protein [Sphingomonas pruni]|uniref:hypothetical protein n=1 Tax=Sphingomonas pruni TaxID=40683 RepID=UPI00082B7F79|nr:hypothetical protein [Sphingomonas pruni]
MAAARDPGWDRQAIMRLASEQYGNLESMFDAHGWSDDGRIRSHVAPTKVVQTYGSVEAFVRAHETGRDWNPMLDPLVAIKSDPPQVFLKSFHGFDPETWGFLGFTKATSRDRFIRESKPGALLVVCATSKAPDKSERLRVLGMQQQSHLLGDKWQFLAPERQPAERADPERVNAWLHALRAIRAWRIPKENRPYVRDIFPDTHNGGDNGTAIGSYGLRLSKADALRVLELPFYEVPVFGGGPVEALIPGPAEQVLQPSRPGPVSKAGFTVREAEGPKHLYILRLHGNADQFLGYSTGGRWIVKVGFSVSPDTRCLAHNRALPACAFKWRIEQSTHAQGRLAFPSSGHALAGENAMKESLVREGRSLGGEFFLADTQALDRAWKAAIIAAENWKP